MDTGDKVLALFVAKALCCPLLALAAGGALGGFGVRLIDGPGKWWLGTGLLLLVVWVIIGHGPASRPSRRHAPTAQTTYGPTDFTDSNQRQETLTEHGIAGVTSTQAVSQNVFHGPPQAHKNPSHIQPN